MVFLFILDMCAIIFNNLYIYQICYLGIGFIAQEDVHKRSSFLILSRWNLFYLALGIIGQGSVTYFILVWAITPFTSQQVHKDVH